MKNKINKTGSWMIFLIRFISLVTGDVTVEQQRITTYEGNSVSLKCIVTSDDKITLSWFFNNNKINTNQKDVEGDQIVTKYNTTVRNSRNTTTYNLQIRNVLSMDDGVYTCRVFFAAENMNRQREIILAVKYLNENPYVSSQMLFIYNNSTQHGRNHQMEKASEQTPQLNISCTVNLGKNVCVDNTIIKSHHKHDPIQVYFATKEQSNAVDGVNFHYLVNVTDDLDGWQFWCIANQSMMLQPVNSSTPILKKPRVNIVQLRNDSSRYKCEVESYPDVTIFRWIICEKEIGNAPVEECKVLNSSGSYVTLMNIAYVDDVLILKCEAQNAVGTGQGTLTIGTQSKYTGMPTTRNTANTRNNMRVGSHFITLCIAGVFVLLVYKTHENPN